MRKIKFIENGKMKKSKYLFLFFLVLSSLVFISEKTAYAQDPEFTQFYSNPIYLNPAFAGTARCPRFVMNYRNQWPALSGTFVTYSASYDQHFDALQGGLGLMVYNDKAGEGTLTTTNISGMYAYQLNINRQFSIRAAVQGSYIQKKIDWAKFVFGDMIDPRYGFLYNTAETQPPDKAYSDFSAGLLAYSAKIYGGLAVHHLTQPREGFYNTPNDQLPMKITVHAGALIPLEKGRNSSTYISPNILYQQQKKFQQLNLGLYINRGPLVGGLWYRFVFGNSDAAIVLIGIQQGIFKFGYSYDLTVSKLAAASSGSHEFSFAMQLECKPKTKKFRSISCPSF